MISKVGCRPVCKYMQRCIQTVHIRTGKYACIYSQLTECANTLVCVSIYLVPANNSNYFSNTRLFIRSRSSQIISTLTSIRRTQYNLEPNRRPPRAHPPTPTRLEAVEWECAPEASREIISIGI